MSERLSSRHKWQIHRTGVQEGSVDTDLTATTDLTFTVERTGQAILFEADGGATETWYPRVFENKGADGDVLTTYTRVALANDRVRLVIANAGNGETARAFVTIADG